MDTSRITLTLSLRCVGVVPVLLGQVLLIVFTAAVSTAAAPLSEKDEVVKQYVAGCLSKPYKGTNCEQVRKEAIDILKDDIQTLGSSADRSQLPKILKLFKSRELELRIAVADAIGMIVHRTATSISWRLWPMIRFRT